MKFPPNPKLTKISTALLPSSLPSVPVWSCSSYAYTVWLCELSTPALKPCASAGNRISCWEMRQDNSCFWFLWACSIMSDGSEAFRGLSRSRVGPLYTLSTTLMEKGLSPSERCWEPLCWQTMARQRGIYLRPSSPREVFDTPSQLCCSGELLPSCLSTESCPLIEKSWNGDCHFDSLFMNNSSIALWITNQWSRIKDQTRVPAELSRRKTLPTLPH